MTAFECIYARLKCHYVPAHPSLVQLQSIVGLPMMCLCNALRSVMHDWLKAWTNNPLTTAVCLQSRTIIYHWVSVVRWIPVYSDLSFFCSLWDHKYRQSGGKKDDGDDYGSGNVVIWLVIRMLGEFMTVQLIENKTAWQEVRFDGEHLTVALKGTCMWSFYICLDNIGQVTLTPVFIKTIKPASNVSQLWHRMYF